MSKLVVWDWNGTVLSDTRIVVKAENVALAAQGKPPLSVRFFQEHFEIPIKNYLKKCNIAPAEVEQHQKLFHDTYEELSVRCRTRRGARYVLEWLSKNNIKAVILSNHTMEGITAQLRRLKMEHLFDAVLANTSRHKVVHKNPKLERLQAYLKKNSISSSEVVNIGDGIEDVQLGKQIGSTSVAITDGFFSTERLQRENPDYLITNVKELLQIIKN